MNTINELAVIHKHLRAKYGSASECVFCDAPTHHFEWANVTGDYTKNIEDYLPMCLHHHRSLDNGTEQARNNFSKGQMGHHNAIKSVLCHLTDGTIVEFDSLMSAQRIIGVAHASISRCFSGRNKTAGGYRWTLGVL